MRPLVFVNGCGAVDLVMVAGEGAVAIWEDGTKRPVSREDKLVLIAARDPRFTYDMNRQIVEVKAEYRGEPETWGGEDKV